MTVQNPRLNIALLVDSESSSIYTYKLAIWGQSNRNVRVSLLFLKKGEQTSHNENTKTFNSLRGVGQVAFRLIEKLEKLRIKRINAHKDHCEQFDLTNIIPETVHLEPPISTGEFGFCFSDDDVNRIALLNLDLIINCCSCGILPSTLVQASKSGIISFLHDDRKLNRGGPPGFWEVYSRHDATEFVIQQIKEDMDFGKALIRGRFPTKSFYLLNQSALYKRSNYHLLRLLNEFANTGKLPSASRDLPYSNKIIDVPSLTTQFSYMSKQLGLIAKKIVRRFSNKQDRWGVAFARSNWKTLVLSRSNKIQKSSTPLFSRPFRCRGGWSQFLFRGRL